MNHHCPSHGWDQYARREDEEMARQEMTITDYTTLAPVLLRLCSIDSPRLANPWTRDGWTYFSDGYICARVRTEAEDCVPLPGPRNAPPPNAADLFAGIESAEPCAIPVVELTPCKDCKNGMYRWRACANCDGGGYIEFEDDSGYLYECECKSCRGTGGKRDNYDGVLCPCHQCRASGVAWRSVQIGTHTTRSESFAKALRLPGVRFGTTDKWIMFWFDGGEGILMPTKPAEAEE